MKTVSYITAAINAEPRVVSPNDGKYRSAWVISGQLKYFPFPFRRLCNIGRSGCWEALRFPVQNRQRNLPWMHDGGTGYARLPGGRGITIATLLHKSGRQRKPRGVRSLGLLRRWVPHPWTTTRWGITTVSDLQIQSRNVENRTVQIRVLALL